MQVNYDRPSSQRPTMVANDSPFWFPNRRVGERRRDSVTPQRNGRPPRERARGRALVVPGTRDTFPVPGH